MSENRWQPYPAYKDSGVGWIGQIPSHWEARQLKYTAPESGSKLGQKPDDLLYLGLENIESNTGRLLLSDPIEQVESTVVVFRKGDVLFGKLRPYLAKVVHADFDGVGTTELLVLRPEENVDGHFLFYHLLADGFIDTVDGLTYGTKMPRTNAEQIGNLVVGLPSLPEQRAIAAFLDRETAKIDALTRKQERLIALLQEKRAAIISHAVTQGLDPDVEMKDSGIPWLGEIPEHWEVKRFKFLTSFVTSGSRGWAQYYGDEGATFLRIGNLSRESIELNLRDIQHVSPPDGAEGKRTRVRENDVLISITAYIGSIGVVAQDIGEAYVNQHIALTRPSLRQIEPRWLGYVLLSQVGASQFGLLLYGGTKDGLGLDDVQNLSVLAPPLGEQRAIVAHIDRETVKLDALIAKAREMIERLQEYRTALISAAVTGKIDVRGG